MVVVDLPSIRTTVTLALERGAVGFAVAPEEIATMGGFGSAPAL